MKTLRQDVSDKISKSIDDNSGLHVVKEGIRLLSQVEKLNAEQKEQSNVGAN